MRCLEIDQLKEVECAVWDRGKHRFRPQYHFLEVEEQKRFNMTPEACCKHMAKVNRLSPKRHELCHCFSASSDGETPKDPDHYYGTHFSLSIELPSFLDSMMTPNAVH